MEQQEISGQRLRRWPALIAVTAIMATAASGRFLIGLIFPDVQHDLAVSHTQLGSIVSLSILIVGLGQPIVGWLVDRLSARRVAFIGLCLLGAGLLVGSRTHSTTGLTLGLGVLAGLGLATVSPTLLTPVVVSWFAEGRTTALSVVSTANPIGQALVVPLLASLVAWFGWQQALFVLGITLLVLAPLLFLLLGRGWGKAQSRHLGAEVGCEVGVALRSVTWWQLAFGFFVCGFTMAWVMTYFVDYVVGLGQGHTFAATGLALTGWASIVGALVTGWWLDRTGSSLPLALVYALRGLGFLLLLLVRNSAIGILFAAFVIGFSWSATTPLTSSLCATLYGRRRLGTIFGLLFAVMPVGTAAGSALAGVLYDRTESYRSSLVLSALAGLVAAAVVARIQIRPQPCAEESVGRFAPVGSGR